MAEREKLIELKDVQITFGSGRKKFVAVDNVNFDIYKGETFSLVGESGSGKTTIGRAILRINPTSAGEILFKGRRINGRIDKELDKEVIRKCQMIFQDPMASLNERAKVDYIISEGLINFHLYKDEKEREEKVQRVLHEVGLLPEFASRFPHEFSGGQRQRIGIARALIMEPEFIVADEPISALDVSIRAQVLNLLNRLKKSRGLTCLLYALFLTELRLSTKVRSSSCLKQKNFSVIRCILTPRLCYLRFQLRTRKSKRRRSSLFTIQVYMITLLTNRFGKRSSPDTLFTEISVSLNSTETRLQNLSNIKKKLPDQAASFFIFGKS